MKKNILIAVLVIGIAVLGYFVWRNQPTQAPQLITATQNVPQPAGTTATQQAPVTQPSTSTVAGISVAWSTPKEVLTLPNFLADPFPTYFNKSDLHIYDSGKISGGLYDQGELYIVVMPTDGIGSNGVFYRVVSKNSKYYILGKDSELYNEVSADLPANGFNKSTVSVDVETVLPGLSLPDTITDSAHNATFKKMSDGAKEPSYAPFNSTGLKLAFTDKIVGDVYTGTNQNGFYAKLPDGMTASYKLLIPFVTDGSPVKVTWSDGSVNTQEYVSTDRGGCGSVNYLSIVPTSKLSLSDLVQVGKTSTGDAIYGFKDASNSYLQELVKYFPTTDMDGKPLASDYYFKNRAFFFWVNQYGNLIKFSNSSFGPIAECGKPVIYLYPTTPTKVAVNLAPVGGFTYTEPSYNSGWNVLAQPDGTLTNLLDSKVYPYLFWEGRGGMYQTPDKGWVVLGKDVATFLDNKLTTLGLNTKEKADFTEFWLPRMQGSPYYFITFMSNDTMNKIAPLSVSPLPDTVIRILMDFKPLDKPIVVTAPTIRTPVRKGFTVVEWGGVLRK